MIDIPQPVFSIGQSVRVKAEDIHAYHYQGWVGTVRDMTFSVGKNCWEYAVLFTRNGPDIWWFSASIIRVI